MFERSGAWRSSSSDAQQVHSTFFARYIHMFSTRKKYTPEASSNRRSLKQKCLWLLQTFPKEAWRKIGMRNAVITQDLQQLSHLNMKNASDHKIVHPVKYGCSNRFHQGCQLLGKEASVLHEIQSQGKLPELELPPFVHQGLLGCQVGRRFQYRLCPFAKNESEFLGLDMTDKCSAGICGV